MFFYQLYFYLLRYFITPIFWVFILLCFHINNAKAVLPVDTNLVFIKSVEIKGLKITKQIVILRELSMQAGKLLTKQNLENNFELDKGRLSHLMLFKKMDATINYVAADTACIEYVVKESSRYVVAPILQFSDRNFNAWYKMYNADIGRLNYGSYLQIKNLGGFNKTLYIEFQNGFNRLYTLDYLVPRLKKYKNIGFSSRVSFMDVKNYPADILNSKQSFYRNDSARIFKEFQGTLCAYYKPNIFETHKFVLGFTSVNISADLLQQNLNLLGDGQKKLQYFVAKYKLMQTNTNSPVYPTRGTKLDVEARYAGVPFSKTINANMQSAVEVLLAYYKPISNNVFGSLLFRGQVSANNGAFFNTRALGYNSNTVRTYEYNIVHGSHFGIARGDVKFRLFNRAINSPIKKIQGSLPLAIYPKIFVDAGYAYSNTEFNNALSNTFLRSAGIGLDAHVNNNHAVRLEFGINHLMQKGLFLNFITL